MAAPKKFRLIHLINHKKTAESTAYHSHVLASSGKKAREQAITIRMKAMAGIELIDPFAYWFQCIAAD